MLTGLIIGPDTPFVKKGIGFDEMFDEEGEEEEEVSIKRKKNKGGVAFRADSQAEGGKQKGGAPGELR